MQSSNLGRIALRIRSQALCSRFSGNSAIKTTTSPVVQSAAFSSWLDKITDAGNASTDAASSTTTTTTTTATTKSAAEDVKVEKVRVAACGDIDSDDEDDEMEQEEMFVTAYKSAAFEHEKAEWGGPRRGGRLPEPTRFGDWERKGRCSDF